MTPDEALYRVQMHDRLVEALELTTTALERAKTAGAEYRCEESRNLLTEIKDRRFAVLALPAPTEEPAS